MSKLDNNTLKRWLLISAGVTVILFALSIWGSTRPGLGDEVCTHWNAAGVCDDTGGKFMGFYLLPIVVIGVIGIIAAIPFIEPRRSNIALSRKAYLAIWGGLLLFFAAMHIILVVNVLNGAGVIEYNLDIARVLPLVMGGLFIVLGNYMGKIRSNFMMGIRTPWTLSSDLSWDKTHRLGGKLFVVVGILMLISIALPTEWWIWIMMGALLPMVLFLFIYSYVVWKNDPNARNSYKQDP
jgi:uncharacterized membrane protein